MSTFRLHDYPRLRWQPTEDQVEAIERLPSSKGFIVADVTGKGKTYSAICSFATMERVNSDAHLLVLSTKSAVASWRSDLSNGTYFDFMEFTNADPSLDSLLMIQHQVSIVTYSALGKFVNYLNKLMDEKYVIVVADEFHRAAAETSLVGRVVRYIRKYAPYFWGLTATPLGNKLESLYHLVNIVKPGWLQWNWNGFLRRYCIVERKKKSQGRAEITIKGIKPEMKTELAAKLQAVMIRRDLNDVNVAFHRVTCELTEDEERRYLVAAFGEMGVGPRESVKQFSARLPDLQLVVNNAANSLKEYNDDYLALGTKEKKLLTLAKSILHEQHQPMVVFTGSLWTQKRLMAVCCENLIFSRLLQINGDSTEHERAEISRTFGRQDLLIMSPAGGESLNLQASGDLVFYDVPFDLRQFVQAAGRVVRMNTKHDPVNIWFIEALETIDSYKSLMVFRNSEMFQAVMKGTKVLPKGKGKITAKMLQNMRRRLLWRAKELAKKVRARGDR